MELKNVDQYPLATKITIPPVYRDLRLTVDEARIFLNQVMNLSLTDQQVAELCRRTEGWIAGVQLVALSLIEQIECDEVSNGQHLIDTFGCTDIGSCQVEVAQGRVEVGRGQGQARQGQAVQGQAGQGQALSLRGGGSGGLSEREYCVLRLVSEGLSNQEIAQHLVVTVSTVKTHLNNIYAKFRVHTRLQAVTKAYDLGLLSPWVGADPEGSESGPMPLN